ncbi:L,D-transpeptidase catalytic domain [Candidatus Gugararchaeum adminiculabundum]|nr:L,D-transpeptidase catalytic domain [Candidatus Gugararchaeum adminiculabundum]
MAETQKKAGEKTNFDEMIAKKAFVKFQPMSGGPTMIGYVVGRDADKKLIVKIKEHNRLLRLFKKTRHEYRVEEQLVKPLEKPAVAEEKPREEAPKPPEEKPVQSAAPRQWTEKQKTILFTYKLIVKGMNDAEKYTFLGYLSETDRILTDSKELGETLDRWKNLAEDKEFIKRYPEIGVAWKAFMKTEEYDVAKVLRKRPVVTEEQKQHMFRQMRSGLERRVDPKIAKNKIAILIDIPSHSLHILKNGKIAESYEVAVADKEDGRTPVGLFRIAEKTKDPWWNLTDGEVADAKREGWWTGTRRIPPSPDNPMGPYDMRLKQWGGSSTNYFIHGTDSRHTDYSTRGCVSVWRDDKYIEHIFKLVPRGTPVQIAYESIYVSADKSKLYIFADIYGRGIDTAARIYEKLKNAGVRITPEIDKGVKDALSRVGSDIRDEPWMAVALK